MSSQSNQKNSGLICVSIGIANTAEAVKAAQQAEAVADVIEIRLDVLSAPEVTGFTRAIKTPLLFTYRPVWEGGFFEGAEADRIAVLKDAIREGAAYIDLELLAPDESYTELAEHLRDSTTQLIVSSHNFDLTPDRVELLKTLRAMKQRGADIGKLITKAHNHHDVIRVLQMQLDAEQLGLPLIAFSMGEAGVISRLATLELGGYMTYCARNSQEATAPGQIPAQTLREVRDSLGLGGTSMSSIGRDGQ